MKIAIILVLVAVLASLFLVGCAATSTPEPTPEPTARPTAEPTPEPTAEPTPEPTESAPVGATVQLLGPDGSYIDMYLAVTNPLVVQLQVPAGTECEVLSGPRTITNITLWEIDCSWSDEIGEGYGLFGWVDVTHFELLD